MPLIGRRPDASPAEEHHERSGWVRRTVSLNVDPVELPGDLVVPHGARAIVVFAHGSGSSRRSPRNVAVADTLHEASFGTLLFDLLTPAEADDRSKVFDIELLSTRLAGAASWLSRWPEIGDRPVAFFGASTGGAAALVAASRLGNRVAAIVSRGGRPDLAGAALERVTAPTLLIVGGLDGDVLTWNRDAAQRLRCEHALEVVPGAGHLFEEPGALERVSGLAADWFRVHAAGGRGGRTSISDVS